jgi:hypothetical protein
MRLTIVLFYALALSLPLLFSINIVLSRAARASVAEANKVREKIKSRGLELISTAFVLTRTGRGIEISDRNWPFILIVCGGVAFLVGLFVAFPSPPR